MSETSNLGKLKEAMMQREEELKKREEERLKRHEEEAEKLSSALREQMLKDIKQDAMSALKEYNAALRASTQETVKKIAESTNAAAESAKEIEKRIASMEQTAKTWETRVKAFASKWTMRIVGTICVVIAIAVILDWVGNKWLGSLYNDITEARIERQQMETFGLQARKASKGEEVLLVPQGKKLEYRGQTADGEDLYILRKKGLLEN